MTRRAWLVALALGAIVAGAIVLRFVDLASNPGGLYLDEAAEALSAHRLLHEPGFHPIFFADGGGREALFAYLVAAVFRLAGETPLALRATAAAIGVAAIPAIWLLGRRFGEAVGLVAAGWAAGSLWLICISRDGMRNTLVPILGALALAALLAWWDRPSRGRAMLAGAVTSLAALYTYHPLKLLPILVIAWLTWLWRTDPGAFRRLRADFGVFGIALLVVAAPMLVVAVTEPAAYFGRAVSVSVLDAGAGGDANLFVHWLRTLGMFAVTGDPNQRHDVDALPLLGWPLFLVFVAGLVRLWRRRREAGHALILLSLPIFLLPPMLATEGGSPHFLRALGLAAPVAVTIGLGVMELVGFVRNRWGLRAAGVTGSVMAAGLVALAVGSGSAYLSRPVADRYISYRYDLVAMARAATPADAVILDDYSATEIRFLDADRLPAIFAPGAQVPDATRFHRVLALSDQDLARAIGNDAAGRAETIARRPDGLPAVLVATP